jgi:hypothetical protein
MSNPFFEEFLGMLTGLSAMGMLIFPIGNSGKTQTLWPMGR